MRGCCTQVRWEVDVHQTYIGGRNILKRAFFWCLPTKISSYYVHLEKEIYPKIKK